VPAGRIHQATTGPPPMPIHLNCSVCGQRLRVPNFAAGRITKCTACGNAVRVPSPTKLLQEDGESSNEKLQANTGESEEFSVSEVWYRSIERLSRSLDWLSDRPIRILFAVLILAAGVLGISTAKWALNKPPEPVLSVEPEDSEPWEGVGLTDANDSIRVTASAAHQQVLVIPQGRTGAVKTPKAYLQIGLKIENLGPTELKYSGWSADTGREQHAARIKDDSGHSFKQVVWRAGIVGQTSSAVIPPSGSISDLLVFENTEGWSRYLKLTLPAAACEGTGNLRIKIPQIRSRE
jgi:hypothetical protein